MKPFLRVVTFIIFSCAFVQAQTVADLARKEKARQQSNTTKTLVITNDNLKSSPPESPGDAKPAAVTPPTTLVIPDPSAGTTTPGGRDEKWWRDQFGKTREEIQRLEKEIPVLENNVKTANFEFLTRSYDPDGRGRKAIDAANLALEQAKGDLGKSQQRLAQLEEDLRRGGGPAGWAR